MLAPQLRFGPNEALVHYGQERRSIVLGTLASAAL
jgi:hypothetical protein